jgi:hypothetical protein
MNPKKHILTILFCLCLLTPSYAIFGGVVGAVVDKAESARRAAYEAFMKFKVIQQVKIMYQNLKEGEALRRDIKYMSEHRGGIPGYVKDSIVDSIKDSMEYTKWEFERDINKTDEKHSYVNKYIEKTENSMVKKIEKFSLKKKAGRNRKKRLNSVAQLASKNNLTSKEEDQFMKEGLLVMAETLESINDLLLQQNGEKLERQYQSYKNLAEQEYEEKKKNRKDDEKIRRQLNLQNKEQRKSWKTLMGIIKERPIS